MLVPRGRLLLTTPSHGRLRLAIGGIERYSEPLGDHLHLYSARSLRELLTEFDFEVSELRGRGRAAAAPAAAARPRRSAERRASAGRQAVDAFAGGCCVPAWIAR